MPSLNTPGAEGRTVDITPEVADLLAAITEALTVPRAADLGDLRREDNLLRNRATHVRSALSAAEAGFPAEIITRVLRSGTTKLPVTYRAEQPDGGGR